MDAHARVFASRCDHFFEECGSAGAYSEHHCIPLLLPFADEGSRAHAQDHLSFVAFPDPLCSRAPVSGLAPVFKSTTMNGTGDHFTE